jgi:hypothetical protein
MNTIAAALEPHKYGIIARAIADARAYYRAAADRFVGTDLRDSAPRPRSNQDRAGYRREEYNYKLARRVTVYTKPAAYRGPELATGVNESAIEALALEAGEQALVDFEVFVAKLASKVGECDSADVEGDLWTHSVLTARKGGKIERWTTKRIINTSSLGKLFHQWPTRKAA